MSPANIYRESVMNSESVTGRPPPALRLWFDAVALRHAVIHSSCSSLCVTKLDVLDELDTIRICTGYRIGERSLDTPPLLPDHFGACVPVYEELPGWKQPSAGVVSFEQLPDNARKLSGAP